MLPPQVHSEKEHGGWLRLLQRCCCRTDAGVSLIRVQVTSVGCLSRQGSAAVVPFKSSSSVIVQLLYMKLKWVAINSLKRQSTPDNFRCVRIFLVQYNCAPFPKYCGQQECRTVLQYCIEFVHSNMQMRNFVWLLIRRNTPTIYAFHLNLLQLLFPANQEFGSERREYITIFSQGLTFYEFTSTRNR